jgi:membrane protease YdiL (CAAX protease family)
MNPFILPLVFCALVYFSLVILNERIGLFRSDFPTPASKYLGYGWLGVLLFLLTTVVTASSLRPVTAAELKIVPFYSLFALHFILIVFLAGWWLLTGRPPIADFLNIQRRDSGVAVMSGFAIGVGGWIITLALAGAVVLILNAAHLVPKNMQPSPMIPWMAAQPVWKKIMIVLSAMTVEEAFFRGWLQKRIGLIASTVLFALAHSGFGQPLLLVGVTIISLIIGFTFYRTKNLIPGIVAHGVFDAVQLFVIIPVVFRMTGMG